MTNTSTTTGRIKRLTDHGYGFIRSDKQVRDIFFHARSLSEDTNYNELRNGDIVEFVLTENDKGLNAEDVRLIRSPASRRQVEIEEELI